MEYPKSVRISNPPEIPPTLLRKLKTRRASEGESPDEEFSIQYYLESRDSINVKISNQNNGNEAVQPMSPISALSPNSMFKKAWKEIESACEYETLPNLDFSFDMPLYEGELLVMEGRKDLVKRWCVIKDDVFTIYLSFKNRSPLFEIKITDKIKVFPATARGILHGFRIVAGNRSVECYSAYADTAHTWTGHLSRNSSPTALSALSHYLETLPESPILQPISLPIQRSAPSKMSSPTVDINGTVVTIPARSQSLLSPKQPSRKNSAP